MAWLIFSSTSRGNTLIYLLFITQCSYILEKKMAIWVLSYPNFFRILLYWYFHSVILIKNLCNAFLWSSLLLWFACIAVIFFWRSQNCWDLESFLQCVPNVVLFYPPLVVLLDIVFLARGVLWWHFVDSTPNFNQVCFPGNISGFRTKCLRSVPHWQQHKSPRFVSKTWVNTRGNQIKLRLPQAKHESMSRNVTTLYSKLPFWNTNFCSKWLYIGALCNDYFLFSLCKSPLNDTHQI